MTVLGERHRRGLGGLGDLEDRVGRQSKDKGPCLGIVSDVEWPPRMTNGS